MNTKDEPPIREAGVMNADVTSNVTTKDPAEYWAARWRIMATEVNKLDIENRKLRAENQNLGRDMLTNEDLERIFSQVENEPRKLLAGRDIAYVLKAYREQSAEIERLKAAVVEIGVAHVAAQTEVERLRQANTMLAEEREAWKAEALNLRQLLRETIEAGEAWKSRAIAIQIEDECDADD